MPTRRTNKETTTMTAPTVETPQVDERIPAVLAENPLIIHLLKLYLEGVDKVAEYNKDVLAEKNSEWNSYKILEKARELARPAQGEANAEILEAVKAHEELISKMNEARRAVLNVTSKELGINYTAGAERDPQKEAELKEGRKIAVEIGNQLTGLAKHTRDDAGSAAIAKFLEDVPVPQVGRDSVTTFGESGAVATPKYRVLVEVKDTDGQVVVSANGFTKAVQALPALYERGKAPNAEKLRTAWEKAGNSEKETKTNPVEFDDEGKDGTLHYVITKK